MNELTTRTSNNTDPGALSARRIAGAAALVVIIAGSLTGMADAREPNTSKVGAASSVSDDYSKPLSKSKSGSKVSEARAPRAGDSGTTTMIFQESDGTDTYSVRIVDGDATAEVNGKPVPADRVRREGDQITILGEDGQVLKTFTVAAAPEAFAGRAGARAGRNVLRFEPAERLNLLRRYQPGAGSGGVVMGEMTNAPPVMIGVTMNDSDGGEGIEIDSVIEGLPAAKAGLEVGDVITHLDGERALERGQLREVLLTKKPGDTLELTVDRDGETKRLTLKLVAFEPRKLPQGTTAPQAMAWGSWDTDHLRANTQYLDEARAALEEALKDLGAEGDTIDVKSFRSQAQQAFKQAMEGLTIAKKTMEEHIQEFSKENEGRGITIYGHGGDGPNRFALPFTQTPGINQAEMNKKLERLDEQLERLDRRLEELDRKMKALDTRR